MDVNLPPTNKKDKAHIKRKYKTSLGSSSGEGGGVTLLVQLQRMGTNTTQG